MSEGSNSEIPQAAPEQQPQDEETKEKVDEYTRRGFLMTAAPLAAAGAVAVGTAIESKTGFVGRFTDWINSIRKRSVQNYQQGFNSTSPAGPVTESGKKFDHPDTQTQVLNTQKPTK